VVPVPIYSFILIYNGFKRDTSGTYPLIPSIYPAIEVPEKGDLATFFLYNCLMIDLSNLIAVIQHSQKTLFAMCGFPYSGKSYVVDQIKSQADIVVVCIDDIFKVKGFDWDTDNLPDNTQWQEIFDESYENVKGALTQGKNVLYESTNQTVASRDILRSQADSVGASTCVVYIYSTTEEVWKRWEENRQNPTRSFVSKELVQMTIDMFEEPDESENAIVINNS